MPIDPRNLPARHRDPSFIPPGQRPATLGALPIGTLGVGPKARRKTVTVAKKKATSRNPYTTHTVRFGSSASDIAAAHGVSVEALIAANKHKPLTRLDNGRVSFAALQEGEKLHIPPSRNLAGVPGSLGAAAGEECGAFSWCDSGLHCEGGVCVPDQQQSSGGGDPYQGGSGSGAQQGGSYSSSGCASDDDCGSGEACVNGACIGQMSSGGGGAGATFDSCTYDDDCASGNCVAGYCGPDLGMGANKAGGGVQTGTTPGGGAGTLDPNTGTNKGVAFSSQIAACAAKGQGYDFATDKCFGGADAQCPAGQVFDITPSVYACVPSGSAKKPISSGSVCASGEVFDISKGGCPSAPSPSGGGGAGGGGGTKQPTTPKGSGAVTPTGPTTPTGPGSSSSSTTNAITGSVSPWLLGGLAVVAVGAAVGGTMYYRKHAKKGAGKPGKPEGKHAGKSKPSKR